MEQLPQNWSQVYPSLYRYNPQAILQNNIAFFEFNGALVHSANGAILIQKSEPAWVWYSDDTPEYLNKLNADGWSVAILINKDLNSYRPITELIDIIMDAIGQLNFRPHVLISTRNDHYSKPNRGMYDYLKGLALFTINSASFFCSGNAGKGQTNKQYQFNDEDKKFADNCNLAFYVPDEILPPQTIVPLPVLQLRHLAITMGQHNSGWEFYGAHYQFLYLPIRRADIPKHFSNIEEKVTRRNVLISGAFGTKESRQPYKDLATKLHIPFIIYWSTKVPPGNLRDIFTAISYENYSDNFEYPFGEIVIRVN